MKAIVKMKLTRPSRHNFKVIERKFDLGSSTLLEGINTVNDFISKRLNESGMIPVEIFTVSIQTNRGKVLEEYKYTPTYR